jgi:hypothetical protein
MKKPKIPKDYPVRPLRPDQPAKDRATCGSCMLSWDDGIATSMTPVPSARCPFETFHDCSDEDQPTPYCDYCHKPASSPIWVGPVAYCSRFCLREGVHA